MKVAIVGKLPSGRGESSHEDQERLMALIEQAILAGAIIPTEIVTYPKDGANHVAGMFADRHDQPIKQMSVQSCIVFNADALIAIGDGIDEFVRQMSSQGKPVHLVK